MQSQNAPSSKAIATVDRWIGGMTSAQRITCDFGADMRSAWALTDSGQIVEDIDAAQDRLFIEISDYLSEQEAAGRVSCKFCGTYTMPEAS